MYGMCALGTCVAANESMSKSVYDSNRVRYNKASIRKFHRETKTKAQQSRASRAPAAWPMPRTMWASWVPVEPAHGAAGGPTPKSTLGLLDDFVPYNKSNSFQKMEL